MLLEKSKIVVDAVVSIKLSNGDELIGKVSDIGLTDSSITIVKPMLMQLMRDPSNGQPAITMAPFWILGGSADEKYKINTDHVICMVLSGSDAKTGYIKQTSNLIIPGGSNSGGGLVI